MAKRRNGKGGGGNAHQRATAKASIEAGKIIPVRTQNPSSTTTERNETTAAEIDTNNKSHGAELTVEFLFAVFLVLVPYGAEEMNLPHNFWFGLGCWAFAAGIAIRMFWILPPWNTRLAPLGKGLIAFTVVGLFAAFMYRPVLKAYRTQRHEGKSGQGGVSMQKVNTAKLATLNPAPQSKDNRPPTPASKPIAPAMSLQSAKHEVRRLRKLYYSEHLGDPSGEIAWENQQLKKEGAPFWLSKHDPSKPATAATVPADPCPQGRARIVGSVSVGDEVGIELNNATCVDVENPTAINTKKAIVVNGPKAKSPH